MPAGFRTLFRNRAVAPELVAHLAASPMAKVGDVRECTMPPGEMA